MVSGSAEASLGKPRLPIDATPAENISELFKKERLSFSGLSLVSGALMVIVMRASSVVIVGLVVVQPR
ncbi:hypothetical protein PSEUDO9AG_40461 [Pseudomonas sp. 9Ag]|nr:hypothetical protein PSEUDO9AG_40461 [Pseudomonas sp. 9Ag]